MQHNLGFNPKYLDSVEKRFNLLEENEQSYSFVTNND